MGRWFPPIPTWDGLHPLIIHFPIGLLLVAPIFIVLAMALPRGGRPFAVSALILMVLGTAGAWVAVATGEAAAELVDRTDAISAALEEHEELAESTRLVFTILTAAFAALVAGFYYFERRTQKASGRGWRLGLYGAFLVCYLAGCVALADVGHRGGMLVHQFGVRALVGTETGTEAETGAALK